ncbi:oligopeptide/dipeptide ABC transporter ATP-binding protein [Nitrincola alkalilacustris]|uniref:oligopeptide/dipeptide ABC transporter ATP-binding protein n=1 Tax=Nitrincola alkalilacustris TaxID=1571224 RepID=UPI00124C26C6|nr:ABC transporter ATP-binding protein [Nitrincola alkalilacustris]
MNDTLLQLNNLRVTFPVNHGLKGLFTPRHKRSVDAVAGVSLQLNKGETLAIVGESGSGKTTLARALNGLVSIASGEAIFDGHVLHQDPDWSQIRREMAMMFQDPTGSLSPRMTVRSLILEPFAIHSVALNDPDQTAISLLEKAGLSRRFLDRYPHQLSGGQARRVGIARAIALQPKLILADEPTAGLDVSVQGEVLTLMNHLKRDLGLTTIIITHNLNILRHIADRVGVMYLGRLVEVGSVEEIFNTPSHPYTKALLSANPTPDPDATHHRIELIGETPSLLSRPAGCEFHTRCPWAKAQCSRVMPDLETHTNAANLVRCHFPLNELHPGAISRPD